MKALIRVSNLNKKYDRNHIFKDTSFELGTGNFALFGQNGIGKSTLLKILVGALPYDSGKIFINNYDLATDALSAKQVMSYVPDKVDTYPFLSGREFIGLVAYLRKIDSKKAAQVYIEAFDLDVHMHKRFNDMSLGTQRKLFLVAAFMSDPKILIMDEPFNDLDNATRNVFMELIKQEQHRRTFLFSTHDSEAISRMNVQTLVLENKNITFSKST